MLENLLEDSRLSVRDLATKVGISRANAHWRLSRLKEQGVIRGFTTDIDPKALGLEVVALFVITVDQPAWREARDRLQALPEIEYLAFTTGEIDCFALARAPDMDSIRDVVLVRLLAIPQVKSVRTSIILAEVRHTVRLRWDRTVGDGPPLV